MPFKKRRKSGRYAGRQTAARGAKERTRHSGNRGGYGMAGTGKRGDQKKTLVIKLSGGNNYFGKDRTLRRGRTPHKLEVINLTGIQAMHADKKEINLTGYKILGEGELRMKATITASAASASAQEKIKAAGSTLVFASNEPASGEEKFTPVKKEVKTKKA